MNIRFETVSYFKTEEINPMTVLRNILYITFYLRKMFVFFLNI